MLVDITIDEASLSSIVSFNLSDFNSAKNLKDSLAIIMMIAGDYSLDPELEIEDLQGIIDKGTDEEAQKLVFIINEDEIEAELSN